MKLLDEFLKKFSEDWLNGFYKIYDSSIFTEKQIVDDFIDTILSEQESLHFSSRKYIIIDKESEEWKINKAEVESLKDLEEMLRTAEDQSLYIFRKDSITVLLGYSWYDDGWSWYFTKEDLKELEHSVDKLE